MYIHVEFCCCLHYNGNLIVNDNGVQHPQEGKTAIYPLLGCLPHQVKTWYWSAQYTNTLRARTLEGFCAFHDMTYQLECQPQPTNQYLYENKEANNLSMWETLHHIRAVHRYMYIHNKHNMQAQWMIRCQHTIFVGNTDVTFLCSCLK